MNNTSILNFKKIVDLPLKKQKKEIDKISHNKLTTIDFENFEFPLKKIEPIFKYIISKPSKNFFILKNITDINYQFIEILEILSKIDNILKTSLKKVINKDENFLSN